MMKKSLLLLALASSLASTNAVAQVHFTYNDVRYVQVDDTACAVVKKDKGKYSGNIEIPSHAFTDKKYTVVGIKKEAFYDCKELTQITLPNTLKEIGEYAFQGCTALGSIDLGTGVKIIGDKAFQNNNALKKLVIPASVDSIGYLAFADMYNLRELVVEDGTTPIKYHDYEQYNFDTDSLRTLYYGRPLPNKRFRPAGAYILQKITFGDAVTSIPAEFAYNDTCLVEIKFGKNIKEIGKSAFYGCKHLPELVLPEGLKTIHPYAFQSCKDLAKVNLEKTNVQIIDEKAFQDNKALEKLVIPASVDSIGYLAFADMYNLRELVIEDGTTPIKYHDYEQYNFDTDSLRTLYYGRPLPNKRFRPAGAYILQKITFGDAVTSIPAEFAYNDTCLVEINFGKNIKEIGKSAFYGCKHLPELVLPEGLKTIHPYAFQSCKDLAKVNLEKTNVQIIDEKAFQDNKALEKLVIPASVDSIGYLAFADMYNLRELVVEDGEKPIKYHEYERYNFDTDSLRTLYYGRPLPNKRFRPAGAYILQKITFGDAVTSIPAEFAYNDTCLVEINFSKNIKEIGKSAFYSCRHLPKLVLPKGLKTIYPYAFQSCKDLATVNLGETNVQIIDEKAFQDNKALEKLVIPASVDSIGYLAFADMYNLRELVVEDGTTPIKYHEYERYNFDTDSLRTLYYGRPMKDGRFRPYDASKLEKMSFGENVTSIPESFAYYCTALTIVESKNPVPPAVGKDFLKEKTYEQATLYVPETSIEAYKAAETWKRFYKLDIYNSILQPEVEDGINIATDYVTARNLTGAVVGKGKIADMNLPRGIYILSNGKVSQKMYIK